MSEDISANPKALAMQIPDEALFRTQKGAVREHPVLECGVADSHAHLGMLKNPALALAACAVHGVSFICCMTDPAENTLAYSKLNTWLQDAEGILSIWAEEGLADSHGNPLGPSLLPRVRLMPGVHPHAASRWDGALRSLLDGLLEDERTCGIGEIGLDYHYDFSARDVQRKVFAEELEIAVQRNCVVSLHLREAHADALEIIESVGIPKAGCILHCCTIGKEELAPFIELGCYVAYGGALTFANSDAIRAGTPGVPIDRLLIETDSPYMTPKPLRGAECTPAHAIFTAQALAQIYTGHNSETTAEQVLCAAYDNAVCLLDDKEH